MFIHLDLLVEICVAVIAIYVIFYLILKARRNQIIKTRDAALTCEELEDFARKIAVEHSVGRKPRLLNWPIPRMNENYSYILSVYKALNEEVRKKRTLPPAAEWLLDNFYIIEEQVKSIRMDVVKSEYARLPILKCGTLKGYARIYAVAMELVAHTDGQIDENILLSYLRAYQSHTSLFNREIWALPIMIRLALIENIRNICEKIKDTKDEWSKADEIIDSWLADEETDKEKLLKNVKSKLKVMEEINPSFVEHLSFRLRRERQGFTQVLRYIDENLAMYGTKIENLTQKEHNSQAVSTVSMGNCILGLKFVSTYDWIDIFEEISSVEQILRKDPSEIYTAMDLQSRNYYRSTIEELALKHGISEIHIAREAVDIAMKNYTDIKSSTRKKDSDKKYPHGCESHVGYYIIGNGIKTLEERLGIKRKAVIKAAKNIKSRSELIYLGSICFIIIMLVNSGLNFSLNSADNYRILLSILSCVAVLIPASEIAVSLVNWVVCNVLKPSTFPSLELKDGIPDKLRTLIVVPALLTDSKRVCEILENLESHYLANREANLYFALVGDFKDALSLNMPEDEKIIETAIHRVLELNSKYPGDEHDVFYFLHRQRSFNESHKKWMGWERKRGALIEFNDLLLGAKETSFLYSSSAKLSDLSVKYVITLDADTILPISMAKKMIGTISHPLNSPVIDKKRGIVSSGYGLIQPKVSFDVESSNKSLFSRIFTGQEGIDPYACAISDTYQDLFGEGIFTGKGIYDLEVFQSILKNIIPENAILSHDLLEGSFIRAGLVTNLELIDSYPSRYNSYAARLHRWVRGDWQLLPWLGRKISNRNGNSIKNPLSIVSKWKIFDNLRRSLVAPALLILFILGFSVLPGNGMFWAFFAMLTIIFPLITSAIGASLSKHFGENRIKRHIPVITGLKATFFQVLLMFVFLPYQAYLMINAIYISLVRVYITKRNMLEWVTAADVEKGQKNSRKSYFSKMQFSIFAALFLLVLSIVFKPETILLSLIILPTWCLAPLIAYLISKASSETENMELSEDSLIELRKITRKTWRYFEEFANLKNHYLAPDNYQEDPPRGIAYRTSPTNIGLGLLASLTARDMGYIGIVEMTELISNTITTIEKMEKWNGHLYNWYDTRTLKPLRPRYISTVDSGNLVCYQITLIQGLKDYLDRPLLDVGFVKGIKDTLSLVSLNDNEKLQEFEKILGVIKENPLEIYLWIRILNELQYSFTGFNTKKSPWKNKAEQMVKMFKKELSLFMSWIDLIEKIPDEINSNAKSKEIEDSTKEILNALKILSCLKDLPEVYRKLLTDISSLKQKLLETGDIYYESSLIWLDHLMSEVEKSLENIESFTNNYNKLIQRIRTLSVDTKFTPLYVEKKQLFSIGFNIEEDRLTNSYYDLLASEARQTSYIAIARGEVPPKHWFKLGRAITVVDYYKGLVSWTGTMFEYLMPLLIMKSYKNTLLDETYSFVLRSQRKYGMQRGIPWGASESGFNSLDISLDYQYKAIGIPWLGLKRGLGEDAVSAPYATFLALLVDPAVAMENIQLLKSEGLDGPYGFYEAVDYTPERLPFGDTRGIIKSFMAHHLGMSLISLNNYLNALIMQRRFSQDPVVKAAQLLLQEKVPSNLVYTKETKEKVVPFKDAVYKERGPVRKFRHPDAQLPKVHILSNGNYSVMLTDKGTGYSMTKTAGVTRWREDSTLDRYGMFFYIHNIETNAMWSAAFSPLNKLPGKYEVTFTSDKVKYKRWDENVETQTEIIVTSVDNAEIRRLTLKNHGQAAYILEVTSYLEVVLAPIAADIAHPSFSNLFVKTEILHDKKCIIAHRRPRTETEKSIWVANSAVIEGERISDMEFETDRAQFIGRGHDVAAPIAIERGKPLSGTSGPVLDPIMSLRLRVKVEPGKSARISFLTVVSESNDSILDIVDKYSVPEAIEGAFKLAMTRSQVETRYLNIKSSEVELYQNIMSHVLFLSPLRRLRNDLIIKNHKGQSSLWAYGISGDLPVILVVLRKSEEVDILYEVLKMHEYWRLKNLSVDLVILNEEENSYTHSLFDLVSDILSSSHAHDKLNKSGGVYIINLNNIPDEDLNLLYAVARVALSGDGGQLADQIKRINSNQFPKFKQFQQNSKVYEQAALKDLKLNYFNGLGGFTEDGKEYVIRLEKGQNTPMPWVNVISNPNFGFVATESGSGYTWCENSRENKLTPWSNDPISDTPGEMFYISDSDTGEIWTITALAVREEEPYTITHGFGYSVFSHLSHGIDQCMTQFVPIDENLKISLIKLKNVSNNDRTLTITNYIKPVLGVNEQQTSMHIRTSINEEGILLIENPYNEEFAGRYAFVDVSEAKRIVTGDRKEFFGSGNIHYPEALRRQALSGNLGIGYEPCAAMQINIGLKENEEKEIVFLFGMKTNTKDIIDCSNKYRDIEQVKNSLAKSKKFWKDKLEVLDVSTPDFSMNIMLNGWLLYQVISCRLWSRSAFYQSGGAFGFRDQLQDSLSTAQSWPELTHNQILLHAKHQFVEGDVQHWWHEPEGKGTRTRFTDDLLWLPYVVAEYIEITEDFEILEKEEAFIEDELLKEFEDERYSKPVKSNISASIYDHCKRAIEKGLRFGEHDLPLMGSGDWNDGMNTVGNRGTGESVWLGWFLYSVLIKFSPLCSKMGEEEKAKQYSDAAKKLAEAIEKSAWDGNWYRRAYFDSGIPLGSVENSECKIDAIAQSWSVISGAGNPARSIEAMNSLENYLIKREEGLIKLLTPPFEEGDLEPGYIKSYVPGVRENGGQYTHAAAWVIIAFAKLGDGDKAWELFELINPINHTRTSIVFSTYKVEPYVMAADVYAVYPHIGRGGWTWYTGAAGWIYRAGMEYILGFRKKGETIVIEPCIPKKWTEYEIKYKYLDTNYVIEVKNPEGINRGVKEVTIDGTVSAKNTIKLVNDGIRHNVLVILGK